MCCSKVHVPVDINVVTHVVDVEAPDDKGVDNRARQLKYP
jgi:hypothetical protein